MNRLAINTVGDDLEAAAEFCKNNDLGLELSAFASPDNLDNNLGPLINWHSKAVEGISPVLSHGPFHDLAATSLDSAIVSVAKKRHETALTAAAHLGVCLYVAHTNYNPMISGPSYRTHWKKRMLEFWLPLADQAGEHDIVICLENMWETTPEIQGDLISAGRHPYLRASFDNGHALVSSRISAPQWVAAFKEGLAHCHLHDNSGECDEHRPVGDGKEQWAALLSALTRHSPQAILVAESDRLEKNRVSIERLKDAASRTRP